MNKESTEFMKKLGLPHSEGCIDLPTAILQKRALVWNVPIESKEFAMRMDEEDSLARFRCLFCIPKKGDLPNVDPERVDENEDCIYLCGQSLGLKPKATDEYCLEVLNTWARKGVHAHFTGSLPAALCDIPGKIPMAKLVGALPSEVTIMNGLTVNLHFLLASFYRPTSQRYKIMIEQHAFSSDILAVKSHLALHGYTPKVGLVLVRPREGEQILREEDILNLIRQEGDSIALLLLPGIHYYTGQLVDIERITETAHSRGIIVGVDAAHAVGNVPLYFHDWNVDFAVWCTYKYLNSGPGCLGAIFVHKRITENSGNSDLPMFKGWWGNNMKTRFLMKDEFDPSLGADMFRVSNPPPLLAASLMASLDIFEQTSMEEISRKQYLLTGYLEYLLQRYFSKKNLSRFNSSEENNNNFIEIITPSNPKQRGSQLSIIFSLPLGKVQESLHKLGIVCDIRMPNAMRIAPAPLYNSFTDVYTFVNVLRQVFNGIDVRFDEDFLESPSSSPEAAISNEYLSNSVFSTSGSSSDSDTESSELSPGYSATDGSMEKINDE